MMNIQQINFTAKHRVKQTKPRYNPEYSSKMSQETLEQALIRYETQQQIENAQKVIPTIKKASEFAQDKASKITDEAKQIQSIADKLLEKIEAGNVYNAYYNDRHSLRGKTLHLYPDEIKFDGKIYDITIYPDSKITAVESNKGFSQRFSSDYGLNKGTYVETRAKDVYKFDIVTGELTYFAQGHKKEGYVTSIEKEFRFINGRLGEYNEGVAKGQFNLILQAFKFDKGKSGKNILSSFGTMKRQTWDKDCFERFFDFRENGTLKNFARNISMDTNYKVAGEFAYNFNNEGNLINFKKDFTGCFLSVQGEKHVVYD